MAPHSTYDDVAATPALIKGSNAIQPTNSSNDKPIPPALLHRSLATPPEIITHASGIYLYLADGRRLIDACGGAAVTCLGHANTEVIDAAIAQMRAVSYVHTGTYTVSASEDLAHIILDGNPYGLDKAYFLGSGSEAMDAAVKMARQYWFEKGEVERTRLVARKQSYHGTTIGSMSIGSNLPRKLPYEPLFMQNVSHVSPAYAYQYQRRDETEPQFVERLILELDAEFQRLGPKNVIAFVAEPLVGATSCCTPAPKWYFKGVREVCDKYDILLILDEVMCGMGRTGSYFAFEQEGITPDIMTMGKGLGGGYAPIAGVLVGKKVVDVLKSGTGIFNHGHTYQAHPLSCATALAVQRIIKRDGLLENCAAMGKILESLLRQRLESKRYVGDIRGRGLFWGIEFVEDKDAKEPFPPAMEFGLRVQKQAFDMGVAIYPGAATKDGFKGDHVLLAPPYNVTKEEIEQIVEAVTGAYDFVEGIVEGGVEASGKVKAYH
ncbi:hypothetical protein MMC21_004909 [Puttea exsequens]|nr:hypothetical protein [Puttea exsequens]